MKEAALAWLHKQLRKKKIALFRAENKPIISHKEIADIEVAIEIIEYIIKKLEES